MFRGRANFFPTGTTPHTNPINTQGPEEVVDVSAINNSFVCWICQKPGHVFRDCTSSQRGFFCFKCGKPNTTDPKCENCSREPTFIRTTRRGKNFNQSIGSDEEVDYAKRRHYLPLVVREENYRKIKAKILQNETNEQNENEEITKNIKS